MVKTTNIRTNCERCGKIIKKPKENKRFCSTLCQTRTQARKFYQKNKDKKWYKDRQRKSFKNWRIENREHFNDLCREKNRLFQKKRRKIWTKSGVCVRCGGIRDREDRKECLKCRKRR